MCGLVWRTWKFGESVPVNLVLMEPSLYSFLQSKPLHPHSFILNLPDFYQVEAANCTQTVHLDWMAAVCHSTPNCSEVKTGAKIDQSDPTTLT